MKRAQHYISITHMGTGESHYVGTVSRITRSCVAAYMRNYGFARLESLNIPVTELEFQSPDKSRRVAHQVRATSGNWELFVSDTTAT